MKLEAVQKSVAAPHQSLQVCTEGGFLRALANIVNDFGQLLGRCPVTYECDMGQVTGQTERQKIASGQLANIVGHSKVCAFTFQEYFEIGHAAMVDIAVGTR